MKTYLLKIIVKKTKPPVWWRVVIPAGITFSTLAYLLDEITQNEPNGNFLFEFYRKLHLFEASDNVPLKPRKSDCDAREASDTFIDDYFDTEKWFSYLRNGNSYRVEIEGADDNDPCNSLLLLKTTAENGNEVYDSLLSKYSVEEGEPPFIKYGEIKPEADGKIHILSSQTPKSNPDNISESVMTIMSKTAELLKNKLNSDNGVNDSLPLDKYVVQMPKDYLLDTAHDLGIRTKTSDNKAELAVKIREHIMEPQNLERMLLTLSDEEMDLFELIAASPGVTLKPEEIYFEYDVFYSLVFTNTVKHSFVPSEVVTLYNEINRSELQNKRKQAQWILAVADDILDFYYGYMPLEKFCRLCRRKADPSITPDEVPGILKAIPWYAKDFLFRDGNILGSVLLDDEKDYRAVQKMHAGKSYYIIRESEIEEVLEYGYPYREAHYTQLRKWLQKYHGEVDTDRLISRLHKRIALGHKSQYVFRVFEDEGIEFTEKELDDLLPIMQAVNNNTRMLCNCGHTPAELSTRERNNLIPFPFGLK